MFSQLWKGQQNFLRHIFILAKKKNKQINYNQFSFLCSVLPLSVRFFSDDVAFQIYTL